MATSSSPGTLKGFKFMGWKLPINMAQLGGWVRSISEGLTSLKGSQSNPTKSSAQFLNLTNNVSLLSTASPLKSIL